jgi:hypothetical protein
MIPRLNHLARALWVTPVVNTVPRAIAIAPVPRTPQQIEYDKNLTKSMRIVCNMRLAELHRDAQNAPRQDFCGPPNLVPNKESLRM